MKAQCVSGKHEFRIEYVTPLDARISIHICDGAIFVVQSS